MRPLNKYSRDYLDSRGGKPKYYRDNTIQHGEIEEVQVVFEPGSAEETWFNGVQWAFAVSFGSGINYKYSLLLSETNDMVVTQDGSQYCPVSKLFTDSRTIIDVTSLDPMPPSCPYYSAVLLRTNGQVVYIYHDIDNEGAYDDSGGWSGIYSTYKRNCIKTNDHYIANYEFKHILYFTHVFSDGIERECIFVADNEEHMYIGTFVVGTGTTPGHTITWNSISPTITAKTTWTFCWAPEIGRIIGTVVPTSTSAHNFIYIDPENRSMYSNRFYGEYTLVYKPDYENNGNINYSSIFKIERIRSDYDDTIYVLHGMGTTYSPKILYSYYISLDSDTKTFSNLLITMSDNVGYGTAENIYFVKTFDLYRDQNNRPYIIRYFIDSNFERFECDGIIFHSDEPRRQEIYQYSILNEVLGNYPIRSFVLPAPTNSVLFLILATNTIWKTKTYYGYTNSAIAGSPFDLSRNGDRYLNSENNIVKYFTSISDYIYFASGIYIYGQYIGVGFNKIYSCRERISGTGMRVVDSGNISNPTLTDISPLSSNEYTFFNHELIRIIKYRKPDSEYSCILIVPATKDTSGLFRDAIIMYEGNYDSTTNDVVWTNTNLGSQILSSLNIAYTLPQKDVSYIGTCCNNHGVVLYSYAFRTYESGWYTGIRYIDNLESSLTWKDISISSNDGDDRYVRGVYFINNHFLAILAPTDSVSDINTGSEIHISTDGITWDYVSTISFSMSGIYFYNGSYYVHNVNICYSSINLINWSSEINSSFYAIDEEYGIAYTSSVGIISLKSNTPMRNPTGLTNYTFHNNSSNHTTIFGDSTMYAGGRIYPRLKGL